MAANGNVVRALDADNKCHDGFSRVDYVFGRGDACDVSTVARDVSALFVCVFGTSTSLCFLYQLWRKRSKGETRASMHQAIALALTFTLCTVAWSATNLLFVFDPFVSLGIFTGHAVKSFEYAFFTATAFLNNAIDTVHSLRPARAAVWHGRVAQVGYSSAAVVLVLFWGVVWGVFSGTGYLAATAVMLPGVLRSRQRLLREKRMEGGKAGPATVAPLRRVSHLGGSANSAAVCPVPLARRGVSLAFLRSVAEQKGVGARTTTAEVCEAIVKPITMAAACAYYELIWHDDSVRAAEEGGTSVLSHTWSYRFRDLLDIIETFESQSQPEHTVYYWFDIFVMNQHSEEELGQQQLLENLRASVRAPKRVLLAIDSWRDPSPLTRVWCLLEIFTAIAEGAELVMCLSSAEQASFAEKLAKNQAEVHRALESVDAEKAEATVVSDREMIFEMIRRSKGFAHFNTTIRDALRHSFERVAIAQRRQNF
eukprot:g8261.t1